MSDASLPHSAADVFPHDRVVFFSDAVFAIAMTLLAVELKVPSAELVQRIGAGNAWGSLIPLFIAFVISFLVTAQFWASHMEAWRLVNPVTPGLLWLGIGQLMFVVLMPFGTALYSESFLTGNHASFMIYSIVLTGISLFGFLLRRALVRRPEVRAQLGEAGARWFVARTMVSLAVFALCIPLSLLIPVWMGGMLFCLIFVVTPFVKRWALRETAPDAAA